MVNKRSNSRADFENSKGVLLKSTRSQITIFIIIAILLVVAIGIVFVVKDSLNPVEINPQIGSDNVGDFVTNCLKITAEKGIVVIGRQGGYYNVPALSVSYTGNDSEPEKYFTNLGNIRVPYYWDGVSLDNLPSQEQIEEQLSVYVRDNLDRCINDFDIFKQKGFDVEKGIINASAKIYEEKVIVSLDYPITITKGESTQTKKIYSAEIPIRLGLAFNLTRNMVLNHVTCSPVNNPPNLNISCFAEVMSSNFNIAIIRLDNSVLLILTDNEYKLDDNYYDFIFAYKYT